MSLIIYPALSKGCITMRLPISHCSYAIYCPCLDKVSTTTVKHVSLVKSHRLHWDDDIIVLFLKGAGLTQELFGLFHQEIHFFFIIKQFITINFSTLFLYDITE